MTRSFRVGRVYGIDIELDYTWFIIFALLVFLFVVPGGILSRYLPPGVPVVERVLLALLATFLFFSSVLIHELCHSIVAVRNGMSISGITLFIFGGVSKMTDEPPSPGIEFRMAIAGPLASLGLAVIFYGLARALDAGSPALAAVFGALAAINVMLGLFNLLPGYPLDGGRVLRSGLWYGLRSLGEATRIAAAFGQGMGALMIVVGLFWFFGRSDFGGLWLAFIGWFLIQAAQSSYQQVVLRQTLSGVKVGDIMTKDVDSVQSDCTLEEVVHEHVMTRSHPAYPVFQNDHLLGLLSLSDIRHVPREKRYETTAGEIVPPLAEDQTISPETEVWEALAKMAQHNLGRLLVLVNGHLAGIVSRTDVMRVLRTRSELGV